MPIFDDDVPMHILMGDIEDNDQIAYVMFHVEHDNNEMDEGETE